MDASFWANQLAKLLVLLSLQFGTGLLVAHRGVRVNYTRKMNHFAMLAVPVFLDSLFIWDKSDPMQIGVTALIAFAVLGLYVRPVRERSPFIATCFRAFDRPEDRPYTLLWLSTQLAVAFAVIVPFGAWLIATGREALVMLPVVITAVGDGLAEPVGVRFGRHPYATRALFTDRRFVRTLEGSACVFLASIAAVLVFHGSFTATQLLVALMLMPPAMTWAEARSPHTWDTPLLFLAGYLVIALVLAI